MPPNPDPWLDPLLDSLAEKAWRGQTGCIDEYVAEARALGPVAVVRVFAVVFTVLRGRSKIDSRDSEPSLSEYQDRLKQALGADFNEDHAARFGEFIKRDPPPPPDAGFRRGDGFSLSGKRAVLRDYQGSGGEGQVWSASFLNAEEKPELATFAVKFEHERSEVRTPQEQSTLKYTLEQRLSFLGGIVFTWNGE